MTREEIIETVGFWTQEVRNLNKTHVQLKLFGTELQMHAYPETPILTDPLTLAFPYKKLEVPDKGLGNRVSVEMECNKPRVSLQTLAAALLDDLGY